MSCKTGVSLYRVGSPQSVSLSGTVPYECPVDFRGDGKSLLVLDSSDSGAALWWVDLASGRRQFWKHLDTKRAQSDVTGFVVTPDLRYYAYSSPRYASDLYIVENLH